MSNYNVTVIPGDGIGPEIVAEAVKVLDAAGRKYDLSLIILRFLWVDVLLMSMEYHLQMRQ